MTVPCMKSELGSELKISWREDTCNEDDEIISSQVLGIELDECSDLNFKRATNLVLYGHSENRTISGFWTSFELQRLPDEMRSGMTMTNIASHLSRNGVIGM